MIRNESEEIFDKKKTGKHESKGSKHVKISKDTDDNNHNRSTSNNRPTVNPSGPITAKTSKLPDAFLDINYKGKRSMKLINKAEKKHHESHHRNNEETNKNSSQERHLKDSKKILEQMQPPKSSHGNSK
jgi:hypothetical protein